MKRLLPLLFIFSFASASGLEYEKSQSHCDPRVDYCESKPESDVEIGIYKPETHESLEENMCDMNTGEGCYLYEEADDEEPDNNNSKSDNSSQQSGSPVNLFISFGMAHINEQKAAFEQIDNNAEAINIGVKWQHDDRISAFGISGLFFTDYNPITQTIVTNRGNTIIKRSEADSFGLFAETGYSNLTGDGSKRLEFMVGAEYIEAERYFLDCDRCYSEKINIKGGVYLKPGIKFYITESIMLSVEYQYYGSGDMEDIIYIGFSWD
ncbi:MAG: hypothetical protein OEY19_10500 [Gammaproteobacteria bacterium]|nr:hypothetical protein [Gammaproteobacteria bacterium]MDH5629427.1 hypothetical protein [Gammaproteobacteria bacterium]